jgi:putative FmdB family regulatory protein
MPTYEYHCTACQHRWDEFQPITAKPSRKCPNCRKAKAKRLISAGGGLLFKGSGFYLTDYRSHAYQKAAEADAKSASGGDSKTASDAKSGGDSKSSTKSSK